MTKYTGGIRLIVIPAGYVGCAFWGGFFVALSGSRIGATVVASMITFALLLSLLYVACYLLDVMEMDLDLCIAHSQFVPLFLRTGTNLIRLLL